MKADMAGKATEAPGVGRRGVLGVLAGLSAGAALAGAASVAPAAAQESAEDRRRARYQETDHVKRFYETNRY